MQLKPGPATELHWEGLSKSKPIYRKKAMLNVWVDIH